MKQHILVVDDEPPIRDLLQAYFKKRGYQVSVSATGPEALRMVDETVFSIVILDVILAETDGIEILDQIKAKHPALPVVIMTGIGLDEELVQEAWNKGASGYVSKTLPLDEVLAVVHRALGVK
jgi:DNA-binding NtrC family response regulator